MQPTSAPPPWRTEAEASHGRREVLFAIGAVLLAGAIAAAAVLLPADPADARESSRTRGASAPASDRTLVQAPLTRRAPEALSDAT